MKLTHSLAALLLVMVAAPALANFEGYYTLTYFIGPDHQQGPGYCIKFTFTGNILGFPNSGTWNEPVFPDWGGYYIVDGKDLRWLGVARHKHLISIFHNPIKDGIPGNGGYDEWDKRNGGAFPLSDGVTTLVSGCNAPLRMYQDGLSPSRVKIH
jgi:hypothetical protein